MAAKRMDKTNSAKEKTLRFSIRRFADLMNEDESFTMAYIKEQVAAWRHDLDCAIKCFDDLFIVEMNYRSRHNILVEEKALPATKLHSACARALQPNKESDELSDKESRC